MSRRLVAAVWAALFLTSGSVFAQRSSASPAPRVEFRPFAVVAVERFTAATTFDATLGSAFQPLWGGGLELTTRRNFFVDVTLSRMSRSGQRAFANGDQTFGLGIPLHATLTPVELTAGRRFPLSTRRRRRRVAVVPYVGLGVGLYRYEEHSDFSASGDDLDATHAGFIAVGGAELHVAKWVGIAVDAQYTNVPGILGQAGVSQQVGERDLGGIAGRVRVILGR